MSLLHIPEQGGFSAAEYAARAQGPAPSLKRRMAAFLYEGVLLFGLVVAVGLVFSIAVDQRHALQHRQGMMAAQFIALSVYFMGLWTHGGQTLAQKTWQLRLLSKDGSNLSLPRALARYLASWLWVLPPLVICYLAGVHQKSIFYAAVLGWIIAYALLSFALPSRHFLHDVISGTRLVDNRKKASS